MAVAATETHAAIDAVWRIESPKIIAGLTRIVRDVGVAEELAQDALVAALEQWPASGVPNNPGAWLMTIAKRRAIDFFRRNKRVERKHEELGYAIESRQDDPVAGLDAALDDDVGDDLLRLIFTACHPVLSTEARVALTLRLLGGLTTEEIARAFLVAEPTIAQRIVRAKKTLADRNVPFEVPRGAELAERLSSVLEVIYLVFNEGYSATAGDDLMRPALCEDALRLGRVLAELAPNEPEVHGLVALMEIQASRTAARTGPSGEPILLMDQDRGRWNQLLIQRGLRGACPFALRRRVRALRAAGGDRRLSCACGDRRRHGLAANRIPLRRARTGFAVAGRRAQSLGRARDGVRSRRRPPPGRSADVGAVVEWVSVPAGCAWRLPVQAETLRRGARRIRARRTLTSNARQRELLLERARACGTS